MEKVGWPKREAKRAKRPKKDPKAKSHRIWLALLVFLVPFHFVPLPPQKNNKTRAHPPPPNHSCTGTQSIHLSPNPNTMAAQYASAKGKYFNKNDVDQESGKRNRLLPSPDLAITYPPGSFDPTDRTQAPPLSPPPSPLPSPLSLHSHTRAHFTTDFYPQAANAVCHPLVSYFFSLTNEQIATRYAHLNPSVDAEALLRVLQYKPMLFQWAGSDLFSVTTDSGNRKMCVVECNSSPSGQKSMPPLYDHDEYGGFKRMIESSFRSAERKSVERVPDGGLAVLFDKNLMEASGYAKTMADVYEENVYLVEYHWDDDDPSVKFEDSVMYIRTAEGEWAPIRACIRYVTQQPWRALPITPVKTAICNPIAACIAGGRNKLLAAKAYELFNAQVAESGLGIVYPTTITDVTLSAVPIYVASLGGVAVIKVPQGNAGSGVYTITSKSELDAFMEEAQTHVYQLYIIQSLVGGSGWSSSTGTGETFYHTGTMPSAKNNSIYVADLRMMVGTSRDANGGCTGYRPIAMYARRARAPLPDVLTEEQSKDSWAILGTNLSTSLSTTDSSRLIMADRRSFGKLGLGLDDLISGFVQTVMAASAIDSLALRLCGAKEPSDVSLSNRSAAGALSQVRSSSESGTGFDHALFASMCRDLELLNQICDGIALNDPAFAREIRDTYNLSDIPDL